MLHIACATGKRGKVECSGPEVSGMVGLDFFLRHAGSSFSPVSRLSAVPRVGLNSLGIFMAPLGRPEIASLVREACLPILSSLAQKRSVLAIPEAVNPWSGGPITSFAQGLPMKGTTPWDAMLFNRSGNRMLPGLACGSQALL